MASNGKVSSEQVTVEKCKAWLVRDLRNAGTTIGLILSSDYYLTQLAEKLHDDYLRSLVNDDKLKETE